MSSKCPLYYIIVPALKKETIDHDTIKNETELDRKYADFIKEERTITNKENVGIKNND